MRKPIKHLCLISSVLLSPIGALEAQSPREIEKLLASDGGANSAFSHYIDVDGDTAIVGADQFQSFLGGVYVYGRDEGGPDRWEEQIKLLPDDVEPGHFFGYRVGVSGDTIVAGATRKPPGGVVYVFERNAGGPGLWGESAQLTPADGDGAFTFGTGLDIEGDEIVVGSNFSSGNAGGAWLYRRDSSDPLSWAEIKRLVPDDIEPGDQFGQNVALDGDVIVVPSIFDDDNGLDSGSAYVFERDAGGPDNWGQVKKLLAPDGSAGDHFGIDIAVSGDVIAVSANDNDGAAIDAGAVYLFERNAGGPGNWGFVRKLTASDADPGDGLGLHVALQGDVVLVGARLDDEFGLDAGAAYLFVRNLGGPGAWGELTKFAASDTTAGDEFGGTVALSDSTVVVGAGGDDDLGNRSGAAWIFYSSEPPLADAGEDQTVALGPDCFAHVELDGSASFDPDGDPLEYVWTWGGPDLMGPTPTVVVPEGLHPFTLTVTDTSALSDSDETLVNAVDVTPPEITAQAMPPFLWPPNHKMIRVQIAASAVDNCSPTPECEVVGVSSNEGVNATGDGNTTPDWAIIDTDEVFLRAERSGSGVGRIYEVTVQCMDEAGNQESAIVEVVVPHSRAK